MKFGKIHQQYSTDTMERVKRSVLFRPGSLVASDTREISYTTGARSVEQRIDSRLIEKVTSFFTTLTTAAVAACHTQCGLQFSTSSSHVGREHPV